MTKIFCFKKFKKVEKRKQKKKKQFFKIRTISKMKNRTQNF